MRRHGGVAQVAASRRWLVILTVGVVAACLDTGLPDEAGRDIGYDLLGAASVAAMAVGALRLPPMARRGWLTVAGGFGCWVLGDVVWSWYTVALHRPAPYPGIADVLYLVGYPLAAAGFMLLTHHSRQTDRAHSFGDAVIVSLGAAVPIWQLLLDPSFDGPATSTAVKAVTVAYPAMDMVLFLLLLRVVFAGRVRNAPAVLVASSLALTFAADLTSAGLTFAGTADTVLNIAWLCGYVLVAAAVWHPHAVAAPESSARAARIGASDRGRFVLLGCAGAASPLLLIALTVLHRHVGVVLLSLGSVVVFGLVLHRLAVSVRRLADAVGAQQRLSSELRHRANHDPLTGTVNRNAFVDVADEVLSRPPGDGRDFVGAFIDLDGFKAINDGAGHFVGDELVVAVADRLRGCVRRSDVVSRFGGDEFAILMQLPPGHDLHDVGKRIVRQFDEPFSTSAGLLHIRASVGLVAAGGNADSEALLTAADAAMYAAKRQGKNRYAIYDSAMQEAVLDRLSLQETLEEALRTNRIEVHYQPIVEVASGQWLGLEALVRCRTSDGRLLTPGQFLPVAENAGLMETIDRTVLTTAVHDLASWRRIPGAERLTVSVNASARALHADDFEQVVIQVLTDAGLPAAALTIELTEDVHIADPEGTAAVLQRLRTLGLSLALDDFGTGYSALAYLTQLPLDIIKVPIQFTSMLTGGDADQALVCTVLSIGRTIGAVMVAEGVETREQWRRLADLGCERGQGYYFARPQPASEITRILVAQRQRSQPEYERHAIA